MRTLRNFYLLLKSGAFLDHTKDIKSFTMIISFSERISLCMKYFFLNFFEILWFVQIKLLYIYIYITYYGIYN